LDLFGGARVCRSFQAGREFHRFEVDRVKLQRRRKVTGGTALSGLPLRVSVFRGD